MVLNYNTITDNKKQGPQRPHKLSSLKSLKILNPQLIQGFSLLQSSEMVSISNSRWQNRKDHPNRFANNGDMDEIAECPVSEGVSL